VGVECWVVGGCGRWLVGRQLWLALALRSKGSRSTRWLPFGVLLALVPVAGLPLGVAGDFKIDLLGTVALGGTWSLRVKVVEGNLHGRSVWCDTGL